MRKIVLATGNPGKVREFNAVLAGFDLEIVPQSDYGVPEVEETGLTFVENALLKARNAARHTGLPALADDSGLVVDALGGAPGIYSARYAGSGTDDRANIEKLLTELAGVPAGQRGARFVCALVLLRHPADPMPLICQASWEGAVLTEPRGAGGFGYDPIFFVPGERLSAAELKPAVKNRLSHRGRALALLRQHLDDRDAG
ncbi:MAG: RdgB/HAM1 family non-canonical purine NTP pyrophosphatase [Candidatus Competibacteraceae bacterium]|nr:RdgB/HAM1 family non-canonical purine NTP pyrophosphatase [Candidatus Competibacteraceae bacterium]MBK7983833.1 RdgB/HAM1 family non-canonical purine NTP pyrophosphatase [Candidatus Competibacteraceae bacterium]MBK8897626.1 RdgB/HAM1 family non-canonical purine NTP pyrophosphatase [Candidatus Competibacteraceae bacterium]MBK8963770.1 RdgB/HAM1 family non-canonical purine NTP pyrophosphatase [Candidatus Competibacteraceae bacterium]MBK9950662.1 RdgB/HAM1 family non-canonical purine NTP pyroph